MGGCMGCPICRPNFAESGSDIDRMLSELSTREQFQRHVRDVARRVVAERRERERAANG